LRHSVNPGCGEKLGANLPLRKRGANKLDWPDAEGSRLVPNVYLWTCVFKGTITTTGICSNAAVAAALAGVYFHNFAYKVASL
jgi:hypothetical protein